MLIHLTLALSAQWSSEREDADPPHVGTEYLDTRKYTAKCSAFIEKVRDGPRVLHRNVSVNALALVVHARKSFVPRMARQYIYVPARS